MAVAVARLVSVTNHHSWSFLPLGNAGAVRLNETGDVIQAASGISISRKAVAEVSIQKQGIQTAQ
jgi:hypothetical protein